MGNLKHIGYNYLLPLFTFMAVGCSNSKEEGVIPPPIREKSAYNYPYRMSCIPVEHWKPRTIISK